MGIPNRNRDFTSGTLQYIDGLLRGEQTPCSMMKRFWAEHGEAFDDISLSGEAAAIDDDISALRMFLSVEAPAKLHRIETSVLEDDENFKAKVDASIEEVSRYGKAVDILTAAIADSSFSTQFSLDKTVESLIELGGTHISAKLRFMESMKRQYGIDDKIALLLWRAYSNPTPANREFLKKLGYNPHGVISLSAGVETIQGITIQEIMAVLAMLCAADGPFPVGDLIALVGAAVVALLVTIGIIYIAENGEVKTGTPEEGESETEDEGVKSEDVDVDDLPEGWTKTENNGYTHIRDENGTIRIRIDPPDNKTPFRHKHLYDENGTPIDINGNPVNPKSPDAHIPIG